MPMNLKVSLAQWKKLSLGTRVALTGNLVLGIDFFASAVWSSGVLLAGPTARSNPPFFAAAVLLALNGVCGLLALSLAWVHSRERGYQWTLQWTLGLIPIGVRLLQYVSLIML